MPRRGHACRTTLESAVCGEMARADLAHEHRSLRFRIHEPDGRITKYIPAIVARRGPILFLVEPVAIARGRTMARLAAFLEQHSPEIVLVLVAPDPLVNRVPPGAYDEIYPASGISRLAARIQAQDPEGLVRPFPKPRARDTPK